MAARIEDEVVIAQFGAASCLAAAKARIVALCSKRLPRAQCLKQQPAVEHRFTGTRCIVDRLWLENADALNTGPQKRQRGKPCLRKPASRLRR